MASNYRLELLTRNLCHGMFKGSPRTSKNLMNGIIHSCCHPEDKAAPENEEETMLAIFEYIER